MNDMLCKLKDEFDRLFGDVHDAHIFFSPCEINLFGEHLEYNGGFELPLSIDRGIYFIIKKNTLMKVRAYSIQFANQGVVEFAIDDHRCSQEWMDLIKGIIVTFQIDFGFDFVCGGNIPMQAGLSSSSSFVAGLSFALTSLNHKKVAGIPLALECKKIEEEWMKTSCNIVDPFIICNGQKDYAFLLNTHTLQYEKIAFFLEDYTLIIANTNKRRRRPTLLYHERCVESRQLLSHMNHLGHHYSFICEMDPNEYQSILLQIEDETLQKRLKYIVEENKRVLHAVEAIKNKDFVLLGTLFTQSHQSLKEDYAVSSKELDILVSSFENQEGCLGAKMIGVGAGGCIIALVLKSKKNKIMKRVFDGYLERVGYEPSFYEAKTCNSIKELKNNF